jgi:hypothetical protein
VRKTNRVREKGKGRNCVRFEWTPTEIRAYVDGTRYFTLAIAVLGSVAVGLFSAALQHHLATIEASVVLKEQMWAVRNDLAGLAVPTDADPATRERLVIV